MTVSEGDVEVRHQERGMPPMRSASDGSDYLKTHPASNHHLKGRPPPPPHPTYNKPHSYSSMPYSGYNGSRPPQQLQSVVTSSFSADDEREMSSCRTLVRHISCSEQRWANEDRHPEGHETEIREQDQEGRLPPPRDPPMSRPVIVPPSPRVQGRFPMIRRAGSSSYMVPPEPLKRSFWHHARSAEEYSTSLPPEFIPPKRAKVTPPPRDMTLTVRSPPEVRDMRRPPASFFARSFSWESREGESTYYHRVHERNSYPSGYREEEYAPHMSEGPPPRSRNVHQYHPESYSHSHMSPSSASSGSTGRRWSDAGPSSWSPPLSSPRSAVRPSPTYHPHLSSAQGRDDVESTSVWVSTRDRESGAEYERRLISYEPRHEPEGYHAPPPPHHYTAPPPPPPMPSNAPKPVTHASTGPEGAQKSHTDMQAHAGDKIGPLGNQIGSGDVKPRGRDGPLLLLALPQDRISLSETLCVVRENIEVFTATKSDVEAPAPGRKHAVVVDQVGLRCIHCRHTTRCSDRVKRAVCYPSSIKRIYRTVIDMKLDHFLQCKYVPTALKERLTELKVKHTRSTGTTMQYFIRAAHSLGMEDGPSGVRLHEQAKKRLASMAKPNGREDGKVDSFNLPSPNPSSTSAGRSDARYSEYSPGSNEYRSIRQMDSMSSDSTGTQMTPDTTSDSENSYTGKITLALPEDRMALSPLRCFLREQVCAFSATEEDIAVRAPTTFAISVGQVGIGCIHCLNQPAKLRSNRAVCFPFSIARIYQSVADIQRFHFGECKMLPTEIKEQFLSLQRASSKGSKGLATRQYWVTSARKIGLVDTSRGIRFGRDPSRPEATSMSLDILAQVAFNVTTASRALVLPEDKPYIAEFLYVVMEQLQPCRFTEADRNKRRLKDVGCIGVECKHCAGQVDGRKFFWSSVNAVESNFVSVHTHMMECRMVSDSLKQKLGELKKLRKEQTAALKTGSQKAFFSRVWARLHGEENEESNSSSASSSSSTSSDRHLVSGPEVERPLETVDSIAFVKSQPMEVERPERQPPPSSPKTEDIDDNDCPTKGCTERPIKSEPERSSKSAHDRVEYKIPKSEPKSFPQSPMAKEPEHTPRLHASTPSPTPPSSDETVKKHVLNSYTECPPERSVANVDGVSNHMQKMSVVGV